MAKKQSKTNKLTKTQKPVNYNLKRIIRRPKVCSTWDLQYPEYNSLLPDMQKTKTKCQNPKGKIVLKDDSKPRVIGQEFLQQLL